MSEVDAKLLVKKALEETPDTEVIVCIYSLLAAKRLNGINIVLQFRALLKALESIVKTSPDEVRTVLLDHITDKVMKLYEDK